MSRILGRGREQGLVAPEPRRRGRVRRRAARRGERGLVALEWLLIVAAAAGIAALSTVTVQRVIDDTSEVPDDPAVRLIDADIAAAFVAHEAQAAFEDDPAGYGDAGFSARCAGLRRDFSGVVARAVWTTPDDPDKVPGNRDDIPARCIVTPKSGLGG